MVDRLGIYAVLMVLFSVCASCHADTEPSGQKSRPSVTIPLKQIWAWQMPGTSDLVELQQSLPKNEPLVSEIVGTLTTRQNGSKAKSGFAVLGKGVTALREAHPIMVGDTKITPSFDADDELSIVFYSRQFGYYVHLEEVTKSGSSITVKYQFVPHRTKELTQHFALIPVGKFDPGKVVVEVVRVPLKQEFLTAGFKEVNAKVASTVTSGSFEFMVAEIK